MAKITISWGVRSAIGFILVVIVAISFLNNFTVSNENNLAWQPSWFHGDKNLTPCPQNFPGAGTSSVCDLGVGYSNIGFPVQIPGSAISGPFWLAWTINISTALLLLLGLAFILIRKFKYGVILGVVLLISIFVIPHLLNLHSG